MFYELSEQMVRMQLGAKGINNYPADFSSWQAPNTNDLPCQKELKESKELKLEWVLHQDVIFETFYKDRGWRGALYNYYIDAKEWISDFIDLAIKFSLILSINLIAAYLHYSLIINKNKGGLWLLIATPLSAIYWQKFLVPFVNAEVSILSRTFIASVLLSLILSFAAIVFAKIKSDAAIKAKSVAKADDEAIFKAIDSGDLQGVIRIVAKNQGVIASFNAFGLTPLHYVSAKSKSIVEDDSIIAGLLLKIGADPNVMTRDEYQWSPLHIIAAQGEDSTVFHHEIAILLLSNGANPNLKSATGWAPIHLIASNGSAESIGILEALIEYNANPVITTNDGFTTWRSLWQHGLEIFEIINAYEKRYINE